MFSDNYFWEKFQHFGENEKLSHKDFYNSAEVFWSTVVLTKSASKNISSTLATGITGTTPVGSGSFRSFSSQQEVSSQTNSFSPNNTNPSQPSTVGNLFDIPYLSGPPEGNSVIEIQLGRSILKEEDCWKLRALAQREERNNGRIYNKKLTSMTKFTKGPMPTGGFAAGRGIPT